MAGSLTLNQETLVRVQVPERMVFYALRQRDEMVDLLDLESSAVRFGGSSPSAGNKLIGDHAYEKANHANS